MDVVEPKTFLTEKKNLKQEEEITDHYKFIKINDKLIAFQPDIHVFSRFILK